MDERRFGGLDVFGVPVDDVTYDEAVAAILEFVDEGGPHVVTTPNPEIVMRARRDPAFRAALQHAALNVPDGMGLLLAARWWGRPLRQHVRGTDLVLRLAAAGASRGQRWFLLGAGPGVAEAAGEALAARYPGLVVAGTYAGSPAPADEAESRARIRAVAPVHVLLVAYGAPAQEVWLARNLPLLDVPVGIGVGGVFDYFSGRVRRAPGWMRRLELEWLYRLLVQPSRLPRQMALPGFAILALAAGIRRRPRG